MFAKLFGATASTTNRRLSTAGVFAATVLGLSACQSQAVSVARNISATTHESTAPAAAVAYPAGTALISDGTSTVQIGGRAVAFPSKVTDAAWSPDGSRIAFIDADGNIATARPDGTSLTVLTAAKSGVTRSNPTWYGGLVLFTENTAGAGSRMESVSAAGSATQGELPVFGGDVDSSGNQVDLGNSAPSGEASATRQPSGDGVVAYQHQGEDGPEVWIVDFNQRENFGAKLIDGSDPALSPDGSKVAFVDGRGQIEVAATAAPGTTTPATTHVTFGVQDPTDLVWTPDGSRIAFSTPTGVDSVAAEISAHADANPVTQLSSTPGTVTFLPSFRGEVDQFTGTDPVAVSITASQDRWPTTSQYSEVQSAVPARSATVGSTTALAADLALLPAVPGNGPLLLTAGSALDPRTATELRRVLGTATEGQGPIVYLLGGTAEISQAVVTGIQHLGYQIMWITSATPAVVQPSTDQSYQVMAVPLTRAVLVDSASPPDELVGTAFAGYYGAPVVKVSPSGLTPAQLTWLSLSGGPANSTTVFGPTADFGGQFIATIAAQEGVAPGYATMVDPQNPIVY
jgi:Tol biopolymer transport system component